MWCCCATRSRPGSWRTDDRHLSAFGGNHGRPRARSSRACATVAGRPRGRPGPGGAVRGGPPRLPARVPRLPGRPRAVLGGLVHLRTVRGRRVHRAVRLLAGPVTGSAPPVPRARGGWRLEGIPGSARRRAVRILPAYYAALAFSLAVAWLVVP